MAKRLRSDLAKAIEDSRTRKITADDLQESFYMLQGTLMTLQMETLADDVDALRRRAAHILAVRAIKS